VQLLDQLKLIATNSGGTFHWNTQAEAASALAGLLGPRALEFCQPDRGAGDGLTAELLRAAGRIGPEAFTLLASSLENASPRVACGALDGLAALLATHPADSGMAMAVLRFALAALESRDVAVVSTAAGMLREKPLLSLTPAGALNGKLRVLRVPDDIEAFQEICATLGILKDRAALPILLELLKTPDPAVAGAAADALQSITGTDYRNRIPRRSEPLYTDLDFAYLRALPDTISATLETARGTVDLILFKDAAPFTIMALAKLSEQRGFFRGGTFHRVVPNFVVQGGDPRGDGWGGPGFTLRSEFSPLGYETGTVGIASAGKDTEGSQFFITHSPQPHLDGRYTIVGRVLRGQDVVDQIRIDDRIFDFKFGGGE
jgi:peptidylprolyl isomerase